MRLAMRSGWNRSKSSSFSPVDRPLGDVDGIAVGALLIDGGPGALTDGDQLVHGGGAVDVAGGERDLAATLAQLAGELRACGRLARPLKARHQHDRRPGRGE